MILSPKSRTNSPVTGFYGSLADDSKSGDEDNQIPDFVDYDEYDAKVFRRPNLHALHQGRHLRGERFRRINSALEIQRLAKSVSIDEVALKRFSSPPRGFSAFDDFDGSSRVLSVRQLSQCVVEGAKPCFYEECLEFKCQVFGCGLFCCIC